MHKAAGSFHFYGASVVLTDLVHQQTFTMVTTISRVLSDFGNKATHTILLERSSIDLFKILVHPSHSTVLHSRAIRPPLQAIRV